MASRPDDRMVLVELVEDDGAPSPASSPAGTGALAGTTGGSAPAVTEPGVSWTTGGGSTAEPDAVRPAAPHPAPTAWARWAIAGAVLALVAVVVVVDRGQPPEPVAVGPLARPLAERWATPADEVQAVVDDVVVVTSVATTTPRLRGLDTATGEERWAVQLSASGPADSCTAGTTLEPPVTWCWRERHWVEDAYGRSRLAQSALVGLDPRDGTVVVERPMLEPSAGHVVVGEDLVLGHRRDGLLTVRRVEATSWREVWSTDVPLEPRASGVYRADIEVDGGFVVVHGPTTAVLDAADGRVLRTWPPPAAAGSSLLEGADVSVDPRGFAAWALAVDGARLTEGTWYDRSGRPVREFDGLLAEPAASDGSVARILLVARDDGATMAGVDVTSGADVWSVPLAGGEVVARRDGAVLVTADDRLRSIEVLTGIERWSRQVEGLRASLAAVSDGETVVVTSVQGRQWVLSAFREADGHLLWTAPAPSMAEISIIAYPPGLELVSDRPILWAGRTLVWLS